MDHMLIDAKYDGTVHLNSETIKRCKRYKVIALYASVQFIHLLEPVIEQLEKEGITIISSKPDRTNKQYQVLGCDAFHGSLKLKEDPDAYLYIGDGYFHPRALVLAQKDQKELSEVIRYDPIQNKMTILDEDDVRKILKKYRGGLLKFMMADNVGVVVTVKPGQQQYKLSKYLREKFPDKNVYLFAGDTIDYNRLQDFPFIDVWVNSACPRIGFDDAAEMERSMVNLTDAINVNEVLGKDSVLTRIK